MGRSILIGEVCINAEMSDIPTFLVATSHLESLDNESFRKDQMEYYVDAILGKYDSVFMGDFNFDFKWENEKDTLSKNYSFIA